MVPDAAFLICGNQFDVVPDAALISACVSTNLIVSPDAMPTVEAFSTLTHTSEGLVGNTT